MLALFEMATLEMWPDVMYLLGDTVAPGVAPSRGASSAMVVYAILWIVIAYLFLMQLFVGVTLETFNEIRDEHDGYSVLTEKQQAYTKVLANALTLQVCFSV